MLDALIPTLRTKNGFAWTVYAPGGFRIISALDQATKIIGVDLELTAGTNDHTTGRHPQGEAFDVSLRGLTVPQIIKLQRFLRQILGERFTVLIEAPIAPSDPELAAITVVNPNATALHVHVQVAKGSEFPPERLTA